MSIQAQNTGIDEFNFLSVDDLYDIPEETTDYIVEGLLPSGGLSVLAGKPKAGKTTLARQLAVAIAQGRRFLNRETTKGRVLYFALEEKLAEVKLHFKQLGATSEDPIGIYCGRIVNKISAIKLLDAALVSTPASLVIIDPLFRFVNVSDNSDYMPVNDVLERVLDVARRHDAHVMTVHHMKKRETEDPIDGSLGSTAIVAACDTFMALQSDHKGQRTICTRQRYGTDLEPTLLDWKPETRELVVGFTCDQAAELAASRTENRIEQEIKKYLSEFPASTHDEILDGVTGKVATKKFVLKHLLEDGFVSRTGSGSKGDPHRHYIGESPYSEGLGK